MSSVFWDALKLLMEFQAALLFMTQNMMPLKEAFKAYELFNKKQLKKIIFDTQ